MNKQRCMFQWSISFFVSLIFSLPLFAQLEVSVNRADAIYNVGQTANFIIKSTSSGTATYEIIYDEKAPVIESGTINLNANQAITIPYQTNEAGVVICRINNNGLIREAAAVFAPLDIAPLEEEPSDFDSFWSSQRNLKNSLPMDMQMSYDSENSNQTTYTFSLSNIEGRRTYGYISIPKGNGPFPASVTFPPYGTSPGISGSDSESAEKGGMIAVSISIHNAPANQVDPNAYKPNDSTDEEKFYYRYGLIGAMHIVDYLETRDDFDGNVCSMGVSQGGGLAILFAGIDTRVSLLINSNSTMGQHVGYKYDRASGFPYYLSVIDDRNQGDTEVFNKAVNATKYYDAMFHARRFKGASFTLTGLQDLVVPSSSVLASYNQLSGSKILMITKNGGHEHPNEYWNGRFEVMRRHFEGSNNPPFIYGPKNKGFYVDAGQAQTVESSANLNGKIFFDENELNNVEVEWRKISGPGNVNFSNNSANNTTANFSSNGTYVLQFVARDDRKLDAEGKIYYISNDVIITVTDSGNPIFTLNLNCSSDQNVTIPSTESQAIISWNVPTANTNCSSGASISQLSGPQNGSLVTEGNYTITYRATDDCGNQEDCSFSINVSQEAPVSSEITLNCPSDIVVSAAPGDNEVTVSWEEPFANTTCLGNGASGGSDCASTFQSGYSYMGTFQNSQFYLSNTGSNWQDAKSSAAQAGGRLAIIHNQEENDFIQQNVNSEIVYIGLSDDQQEGNMIWQDGSNVSYSKYVSNLNNNQSNDFAMLYPWNGEWDLANQYVVKRYVLEIPCSNDTSSGSGNGLELTQAGGGANGSNFAIGTSTVTYTATDNCGNTATCSFNVTVNATSADLNINCPSDLSVQIPTGQSSMSVSWNEPTANSNCVGGARISQISGDASGNQFTPGNYTITYSVTDDCGNQEDCSFSINVSQEAPASSEITLNCPSDIVVSAAPGDNEVTVSWEEPFANTTCLGNGASGGSDCASTFQSGYSYMGTFQNSQFYLSNTGSNWQDAKSSAAQAGGRLAIIHNQEENDFIQQNVNSEIVYIGLSDDQQEGNLIWQDGSDVSYSKYVSNLNNNQSNDFAMLYPWNGEWDLANQYVVKRYVLEIPCSNDTSSGSGNGLELTQAGGGANGSNFSIGTSTVTYTATDNCGNTATCSFNVTVNESPITTSVSISCTENQTMELPQGIFEMPLDWTDPTAFSNCAGDVTIEQTGGESKYTSLGVGTYTISYEATDNCGNSDVCNFVISIVASTVIVNPSNLSLSCPDNITVEIPSNQSSTSVNWSTPTASSTCNSNSGGTNCSSTDINGYSYVGEFAGSKYYKSNEIHTYAAAKEAATTAGGNIVKITSAEENEFIRQGIGRDLCIIGINDAASESNWKWADESNATYLNFPGSVNNNSNNDYGVINFWNGEWELITEIIQKKYVLEIPCDGQSENQQTISVNRIAGPSSGSNFGVGTTTISYQAADDCGNSETCSFTVTVNQAAPVGNNQPPTAVLSTSSTTVSDDFMVRITFNKPVTGLGEFDLLITNANWYNFNNINGKDYTIMIDPINPGNVSIQVPTDVAFDSDIQGNIASNRINVNYIPVEEEETTPISIPNSSSCIITPSSAILENGRTVGGSVNNLIDGSTLSGGTDLDAVHGGGSLYDGVWLNDGLDATINFDLGQSQAINGLALWNYTYHTWMVLKRRGVRDFQISTSNDGVNFSSPISFTAAQTTERGEFETVQTFNFPNTTARYVKLHFLNSVGDSFYVGLGEIRFLNNCTTSTSRVDVLSSTTLDFQPALTTSTENIDVKVYPNPFSDNFYLDINSIDRTSTLIQVMNEVGAIVYSQKIDLLTDGPLEIDLEEQSTGMYFIRILRDEKPPILKKIIKINR